jgi:acetaldehyde dehydrogenase / alcohol dehydrogenase
MGIYPGYHYPQAMHRYAEIAKYLGLSGNGDEELMEAFISKVYSLFDQMSVPRSFQLAGIDETQFNNRLEEIALKAFDDQCTPANPRFPLVTELQEVLKQAYYGTEDYQLVPSA